MDYKLIGSLAEAGYTFAPTGPGMTRSNRTDWTNKATNNKETLKEWLKAGDSLVSVAKRGHQYIFDIDDPIDAIRHGFKLEWLTGMFIVDTPSGGIHASGLHDAITAALPYSFMNVRAEKNNPKSKLIVELKLNNASTAAPSADRFGVKGKKDGVYQPRGPFTGTVTGIDSDLLEWVKANVDDKAPTTAHGTFKGFHPDFDLEEFLENEDCTEFASGSVDGAFHVVVEECPHCGKAAVNSTLRAGISKFIFGGTGVGFICHACGIGTWAEHVAEMENTYTDYEKWDEYIYRLDDPKILFAGVEVVDDDEPESEPEPVVEEDDFQAVDTSELINLGYSVDEDNWRFTLNVQTAASIKTEEMKWLWPGRFPAGKVIIISGKTDCGKTICLQDFSSRVSTGANWPDGEKNQFGPRRVMYASSEDDPVDTLVPRFKAAGANLHNILLPKVTMRDPDSDKEHNAIFNLKRDLQTLYGALKKNPDIAVLVLDPITSFIGNVNINKDEEVRPLFDKLIQLAAKTGITVLGLVHANKRSDVNAVEKVLGASSMTAAARAVWTFTRDSDDKELLHMVLAKGNVLKKRGGMEYKIVDAQVTLDDGARSIKPRIEWGKETEADAQDLLLSERAKAREGASDKASNIAIAVLRETVPGFATDMFRKAEAEGIAERTIYRAKEKLGIQSARRGGKAWWYIPGEKGDPTLKPAIEEAFVPHDVFM